MGRSTTLQSDYYIFIILHFTVILLEIISLTMMIRLLYYAYYKHKRMRFLFSVSIKVYFLTHIIFIIMILPHNLYILIYSNLGKILYLRCEVVTYFSNQV